MPIQLLSVLVRVLNRLLPAEVDFIKELICAPPSPRLANWDWGRAAATIRSQLGLLYAQDQRSHLLRRWFMSA